VVDVSNPDKVLFPEAGYTKLDVVGYYVAVADRMLPHIVDRPLTIHRFPNGIGAKGFMQKNAQDYFPDNIGRIELPKRDGVTNFPVVRDAEGLAYLANLGAIAFHVPTSRIGSLRSPDRFVLDLDPDEGDVVAVQAAALAARELLTGLGLDTTPMTTGSKGYHLVARLDLSVQSDDVSHAAQGIAWLLAHAHPEHLTTEFRKANRKGRVFIDWMRNSPMATGVAAWSLRARRGAPVATPIAWNELATTEPNHWNMRSIPERLEAGDPILAMPEQSIRRCADAVDERLGDLEIDLPRFDRFRS